MGSIIVIRKKMFQSQLLPLDVIVGDEFIYGRFDDKSDSFVEGKYDAGSLVLLSKKNPGRSFNIAWSPYEKKAILIFVTSPTTSYEFDDLFLLVKRVKEYWNAKVFIDQKEYSLEQFFDLKERWKKDNPELIKSFFSDLLVNEKDFSQICLPCARSILYPGEMKIKEFIDEPSSYEQWLTEKQKSDAFFLSARLGDLENDPVICYYDIELTRKQIIPYKERKSLCFDDLVDNCALQWQINILDNGKVIATIDSLQKFYEALPKNYIEEYDSSAYILNPLDNQEIEQLKQRIS